MGENQTNILWEREMDTRLIVSDMSITLTGAINNIAGDNYIPWPRCCLRGNNFEERNNKKDNTNLNSEKRRKSNKGH